MNKEKILEEFREKFVHTYTNIHNEDYLALDTVQRYGQEKSYDVEDVESWLSSKLDEYAESLIPEKKEPNGEQECEHQWQIDGGDTGQAYGHCMLCGEKQTFQAALADDTANLLSTPSEEENGGR